MSPEGAVGRGGGAWGWGVGEDGTREASFCRTWLRSDFAAVSKASPWVLLL